MANIRKIEGSPEVFKPHERSPPNVTLGGGHGQSQLPADMIKHSLLSVLSTLARKDKDLHSKATLPDIRREAERLNMSLSQYLIQLAFLHHPSAGDPRLAIARFIVTLGLTHGPEHDAIIQELHKIKRFEGLDLTPIFHEAKEVLQKRLSVIIPR